MTTFPFRAAARFAEVFCRERVAIIGMVHVAALPGAPRHSTDMKRIIETACHEASVYSEAGVDGVLVENMHDVPYLNRRVGPETTAAMAVVCKAVRDVVPTDMPCGVQILAGANREALAVAKASGFQFIRAEGFVFGHVADEGLITSDAGELLRYRRSIRADNVLVLTDIKKKHSSHSITADVNISEMAQAAELFGSDGVIVTGMTTGHAAEPKQLAEVKEKSGLPVLIGSGVTVENVTSYRSAAALIVGSHFKTDGQWWQSIDRQRLDTFMQTVQKL